MFSGMFWSGLGQVWNLGVGFVISLILARLLTPEEFGVVAIIGVFIAIFSVFIDAGFGASLIQKKDLHPEDCSSVFFLNLTIAITLYIGLFFAAPLIADFFHKSILTPCIRVSALAVIFGALSAVQNAMIYRDLRMNVFFRMSVVSQSISGAVGITMAYRGFGVWALVMQTLIKSVISAALLWIWGTWRPILRIRFQRLKGLFQYGWKLLCSGVLDCFYNNMYPLLFGKLFDFSTLAYYNRGNHIPSLGMGIINNTISSVLFPSFSRIQNDPKQMARVMKKVQSGIFFFVVPTMTLLCLISEPLIVLLFKEKWLPAVPFMRLFCLFYMFWPFHTSNLCVLQACGRSDVFLILEIIKKVQAVVCVLLTYRYGPFAMACGLVITNFLSAVENSWMNGKIIQFGFVKQILNISPCIAISFFCSIAGWFVCENCAGVWSKTILTTLGFGVLYLGISFVFKQIPRDIIQLVWTKLPFGKRDQV